jgi:hypothetical protein
MTSVTVQRWISDYHVEVVDKLLKPMTENQNAWLIYEIDDLMDDTYIPLFNRGRLGFENEHIQRNIKYLLHQADIVTVTTDYIKEAYHRHYDVPLKNIVALPNMLPRYLFGDRYDPVKKAEQFRKLKSKPRIGIVSSLSHYNISDVRRSPDGLACRKRVEKTQDGKEVVRWFDEKGVEIPEAETKPVHDDMDIIVDMIRETHRDFQWVFFGYAPPKLMDLVAAGKIEVHRGSPIMTYPSILEHLSLQAIVAPIQDIEFNRCKSPIKYMECAAIGVPLFASRAIPYVDVMPDRQLFSDANELKDGLMKLKFSSAGLYTSMIERQWEWLNKPCHMGDFDLKNFWLEDNIDIWMSLFKMRNKCINCSLSKWIEKREKAAKEKAEHTIYSNGEVEILK